MHHGILKVAANLFLLLNLGVASAWQPQTPATSTDESEAEAVSLRHYDLQELRLRLQMELGLTDVKADEWLQHQFGAMLETDAASPLADSHTPAPRGGLLSVETSDGQSSTMELSPRQRGMLISGDRLTVLAGRAEHRAIQELLQTYQQMGIRQIVVSTHILRAPSAVLNQLPIRWSHIESTSQIADSREAAVRPAAFTSAAPATAAARYLAQQQALTPEKMDAPAGVTTPNWTQATSIVERATPVRYTLLTPAEYTAVLDRTRQLAEVEAIMKPKVVVFNQQLATISNCVERPFVTGIKPVVLQHHNGTQQVELAPQVRVYPEGTLMKILPELLQGEQIRLNYDLRLSKIRDVQTITIPGADAGDTFVIQLPEIASTQFRTCIDLPIDSTLAVSSYEVDEAGQQQSIVVLCHCSIREVAEATPAKPR